MDTSIEEGLVADAQGGDRKSLETLLEEYQSRVFHFGLKMCAHPQDAEDVLQETLLAATRSIHNFRGDASFRTWLFRIAQSFCIKKRRRSKFAPEHEYSLEQDQGLGAHQVEHPGKAPDEATMQNEVRNLLERAIETLDPEQREVLVLRDVEGLKASEVADVLGISVAATKSRLHRARVQLRQELSEELGNASQDQAPLAGCPDVVTLYSKYIEDEISPDLCTQMQQHLSRCTRCEALCDSLKDTLSMCSTLPSKTLPPSVQAAVRSALREALQ